VIVAAGVLPPHFARVGEDQETPAVLRPRVVVDVELRRRQDTPRPGRRVVSGDLRAPFAAFDDRVGRPVGQPPRRAEPRRGVRLLRIDAIDLGAKGAGDVGLLRAGYDNECGCHDGDRVQAT
jgi:hypothetical protein